MVKERHGLSIGIERTENSIFLSLKLQGMLTHHDYQTFAPMIDSALLEVKSPKVKFLIDGTELQGWEPRAAWDDFKLGLKHGNEFGRPMEFCRKLTLMNFLIQRFSMVIFFCHFCYKTACQ